LLQCNAQSTDEEGASMVLKLVQPSIAPIPVLTLNHREGNARPAASKAAAASSQQSAQVTGQRLQVLAPVKLDGVASYRRAMAKYNVKATLKEARLAEAGGGVKLNSKATNPNALAAGLQTAGFAASTGAEDDSSWLTEVQIGTPPKTLLLNFDSGSSDTWVMSTDLPVSERQGQVLYNPASSRSALAAPSNTWNITYADKSGASGFVGTDTLYLGGMPIRNQAIERATYVSKDFFSTKMASGLLGLGFSSLNTVKPNPVRTPMENLIRQGTIQNPIFTVALRDSNSNATGQGGHYTFGYIDQNTYKGQIWYAPVNTSQGFWQVNCPYFKIGRNGNPLPRSQVAQRVNSISGARSKAALGPAQAWLQALSSLSQGLSVADAGIIAQQVLSWGQQNEQRNSLTQSGGQSSAQDASRRIGGLGGSLAATPGQPDHPAIIDTGTTLMLLDDMTLLTIYNSIPGAKFDSQVGGYTIPCNAVVPDTFWLFGDQFYGVPGSVMAFAKLDSNRCYGAMQSRGDFPTDIFGDAFIKNQMIVFDQNPTNPRIGFAYRPDIQFREQ
jgi:hypothetical protein